MYQVQQGNMDKKNITTGSAFQGSPFSKILTCSHLAAEQGTTPEDIRLQAWAVQLGPSTFVGQYQHLKVSKTFAVKVGAVPVPFVM